MPSFLISSENSPQLNVRVGHVFSKISALFMTQINRRFYRLNAKNRHVLTSYYIRNSVKSYTSLCLLFLEIDIIQIRTFYTIKNELKTWLIWFYSYKSNWSHKFLWLSDRYYLTIRICDSLQNTYFELAVKTYLCVAYLSFLKMLDTIVGLSKLMCFNSLLSDNACDHSFMFSNHNFLEPWRKLINSSLHSCVWP